MKLQWKLFFENLQYEGAEMEYFAEKWNLSTSRYKDAVYKIWSKLKVIFELWYFKLVILIQNAVFDEKKNNFNENLDDEI